uniref:Testicular haploid expressed gene protein isoform X4 n=1 Tax=Callorhinus ursinus TaxID=34884 RepID=A0A3Q7NAU6_CALUR|nr:testicular haploid expressed gene protein isoform X4 [Callorhinus ursinus]
MGDQWQSSLLNHHSSEAGGSPHRGRDYGVLGMQGMVSGSRQATDTRYPDDGELRFEDQQEETLPEEVTGEEAPGPRNPKVALPQLDRVLEKDADDGIPEMSRLSITQRFPSNSSIRARKRRKRVFELAKPKTNWQVLKDRMGCCCKGYAWVSPCKRNLQFCVYWPSVYWTERFLEDTTLTITVPEVSRRVEELARPKRFYSEYYNNNRTAPVWPVPRSSLEYQASSRLRELAAPRVRNNIWSINMSESGLRCVSHGERKEGGNGGFSGTEQDKHQDVSGVPGIQGSPDGHAQPEDPMAGKAQVPSHPVGRVGPRAQTQAARVRLQSPPSLGHAQGPVEPVCS